MGLRCLGDQQWLPSDDECAMKSIDLLNGLNRQTVTLGNAPQSLSRFNPMPNPPKALIWRKLRKCCGK